MGKLTIVRHGQAAFMTEDYDRLSPLGEEQSLALGRYWARHGVTFTHAFTGPRKRHRATARHAMIGAEDEGLALPEVREAPGFDEYDWEALFTLALSDHGAALPGLEDGFAANVRLIGDCVSPRRIGHAMLDGHTVARRL